MEQKLVGSGQAGKVALVRLAATNPLNPLTDALIDGRVEEMQRIEFDPAVHATLLTGSERAFAAGADFVAMSKLNYTTALWKTISAPTGIAFERCASRSSRQ